MRWAWLPRVSGGVTTGARADSLCRLPGLQHSTERKWLFGLLRQGIRDRHCYALYARRGVFHVLLAFFHSPLCDQVAQVGAARRFPCDGKV